MRKQDRRGEISGTQAYRYNETSFEVGCHDMATDYPSGGADASKCGHDVASIRIRVLEFSQCMVLTTS